MIRKRVIRGTAVTVAVLAAVASSMCVHVPADPYEERLQTGTFDFGGRARTYVYLEPEGPALKPLVVSLHGRLGTGLRQARMTGLTSVALREGFIALFPDGVDRSWADAREGSPASKQGVDDVGFLSALIDLFVAQHHADPSRVYVMGLSNGGVMTLTLACRLADKIAAAASVIGGMPENLREQCKPARAIPLALMQGDEDPLMPFDGGVLTGGRGAVMSFFDALAVWRGLNGCAGAPVETQLPDTDPSDGTTTSLLRSPNCSAEVRGYVVRHGGHTWPGGAPYMREVLIGKTSKDFSASEELWAFLKLYALPLKAR